MAEESQQKRDRYSDPFVRILELYVLAALGALEPSDRQAMKEVTPSLQEIYNLEFGWQKIVEHVMEFGAGADEEIRTMWKERKAEAAELDQQIRPEEFAREFADRYFPVEDDEG